MPARPGVAQIVPAEVANAGTLERLAPGGRPRLVERPALVHEHAVGELRRALLRELASQHDNFRNVLMYAPNGKKDGIQLIPVPEVAAKDEFFNIKNVTRDDQLAAHRVPPQLLGIVPSNSGGFGTPDTAARVFGRNGIKPLQARFVMQFYAPWLCSLGV